MLIVVSDHSADVVRCPFVILEFYLDKPSNVDIDEEG